MQILLKLIGLIFQWQEARLDSIDKMSHLCSAGKSREFPGIPGFVTFNPEIPGCKKIGKNGDTNKDLRIATTPWFLKIQKN